MASSSRIGGKLVAAKPVDCKTGVPIRGVARECVATKRAGTTVDGAAATGPHSRLAVGSMSDASDASNGICIINEKILQNEQEFGIFVAAGAFTRVRRALCTLLLLEAACMEA